MGVVKITSRTLYLFPDTNLFIQCHLLPELPWSKLGEFDEIHLIVCRPVQREIDTQKNRGKDRVGKRARTTYKLFREIIASGIDYKIVRDSKPVVKLYLEALSLPDQDLIDLLDYSKPDDEIVGSLHRFKKENQDKDARLLTHDGGPMMTAKSLGLTFIPISADWLLPQENSEAEKEIARLKDRLAQLQNAEPQLRLKCLDSQGEEIESLEVEYLVYEPMTRSDVSALSQSLREQFPPATDFESREHAEGRVSELPGLVPGAKATYTPASDEAIANYTDRDYPKWLGECEDVFANLHETLQQDNRRILLSFVAANVGTRPGRDVLVQIEAKGRVRVCVPSGDYEDTDEEREVNGLRLPSPPRPPHGRWKFISPSSDLARKSIPLIEGIRSHALRFPSLITAPDLRHIVSPMENRRDPNAFYYKPDRPSDPVESFSLECEQWRHGIDGKYFDVEVVLDFSEDRIEGAVECSIHAENVSTPPKIIIPVRVLVKRVSTRGYADELIENLVRLNT